MPLPAIVGMNAPKMAEIGAQRGVGRDPEAQELAILVERHLGQRDMVAALHVDRKASWRSGIHFTVRFSSRLAHTTSGYSGCTKIFMPKPPPTSPVRTRSLGWPIFRIMSATTGRMTLTP